MSTDRAVRKDLDPNGHMVLRRRKVGHSSRHTPVSGLYSPASTEAHWVYSRQVSKEKIGPGQSGGVNWRTATGGADAEKKGP
jgi:hypothetical protein